MAETLHWLSLRQFGWLSNTRSDGLTTLNTSFADWLTAVLMIADSMVDDRVVEEAGAAQKDGCDEIASRGE